jgi:hypothetical protein
MTRHASWAVLGLLLAATLIGALTFDRRAWPGLVGDEATYLMQAQSLAWDFDLRYERRDFDRFVAQWGRRPEGLILQSADSGRTITYSKPVYYAALLAPFVRLAPVRGAMVANVVLLALAAFLAARTLQRSIGPAAPLWVAVWIFGSVSFAYVFWAHPDLFLMSLTAIALALTYSAAEERRFWRPFGIGLLLTLVTLARPFYGALFLPVALSFRKSWRSLIPLVLGGLVLILAGFLTPGEEDAWTIYGGERQSFDSSTGFPEVDFPAGAWREKLAARGSNQWRPWIVPEAKLAGWNSIYFLAGRHVGVLPYFLPLILGFFAFRPGAGRWALPLAVLAAAACFLALRPFNFYGGGGAIANRYFLPLYPALWFVAARPARAAWVVWGVVVAALAAPFLWPLWTHPRAFLLAPEGGYTYVSNTARRWLPYETTQSHLKPSGREDFVHNGLWIKLLTPRLAPDGTRIAFTSEGDAQLLVGSPHPIAGLKLQRGGAVEALQPRLRASHPMWWTDEPYYLYQLRLEGAAGEAFSLSP